VRVEYEVEEPEGRWLLDGEDMPEIPLHDAVIQLLELLLQAFVERERRSALITSNLGCRWDPADARVGVDPDVLLVEPSPPDGEKTTTLRIWEPGHAPPRIAVEVVSDQSGRKDYLEGPARYGRLGAGELWIFDPLLVGPPDTGGPFVLQVWGRNDRGAMDRVYAGPGPAHSDELRAWLVVTDGGTRLRIAEDPAGDRPWLTKAEAEARRADTEACRAETEARRADAAEAELARLREELARRGS
jgi:hypothetical protein